MSWKWSLFTLLPYHPRRKSSWYPPNRRMGSARPGLDVLTKRNISYPCQEIKKLLRFLWPWSSQQKRLHYLDSNKDDVKHILSALWTLRADYFYVQVYSWPTHHTQLHMRPHLPRFYHNDTLLYCILSF